MNGIEPTQARHTVLGFTLVLTAIAYLDRICISTTAPFIQKDLQLSDAEMGYVFSVFTLAYALCEIPAGWLADRFGPRRMLLRVVVAWSILTFMTGFAWGFVSLLIIRLVFGMGEAGTFPGIARVYARWLPSRDHGWAFGLAVMTGALGGAFTQVVVIEMLRYMTWHWIFHIFGMVGLVWAGVWYWWFRDDPHEHRSVNAAELALIGSDPPKPHGPVPWISLARDRNVWALSVMYFGIIYGWYFFLTWMPKYLLQARGFDLHKVGVLSALPLLTIATGVFAGGWLSDRLKKHRSIVWARRWPGLIGLPVAAFLLLLSLTLENAPLAAVLMALAAGFAALGVAPGWAVCLDISPEHAGVVTGTMNMFGNLGGAICPVIVGWCLQWFSSWNISLTSVAFFYLVALGAWMLIDPTRKLRVSEVPGGV